MIGFNPILVRLQPGGGPGGRRRAAPFQSHLGSITTRLLPTANPSPSRVSIPSWFDYNPETNSISRAVEVSFNPILVRLQQFFRLAEGALSALFQSHLGSITTGGCDSVKIEIYRFQSHLGSITTLAWLATSNSVSPSFNPILVRLQLAAPAAIGAGPPVSIPSWFDYNGDGTGRGRPASMTFQSHLGSITTPSPAGAGSSSCCVSIPSWFDYNQGGHGP